MNLGVSDVAFSDAKLLIAGRQKQTTEATQLTTLPTCLNAVNQVSVAPQRCSL